MQPTILFLKAAPTVATASPAQLEAGNYRKKKIRFQGLLISIENPKGSARSGVDPDGHPWRIEMKYDYGYIRGTLGVDGDHVDCYIGPDATAENAYIVHQRKAGKWDQYDEDKVMLGFPSEAGARDAYLAHYDDPRFLGPITVMPMDEFKAKVMTTLGRPRMLKAVLFAKATDYSSRLQSLLDRHHPGDNAAQENMRMPLTELADRAVESSEQYRAEPFVSPVDERRVIFLGLGRPLTQEALRRANLPVICLDFDVPIHSYTSGWQGETVIPDPLTDGARAAIQELRTRYRVFVNSARCATPAGRAAVADYLERNGIEVDEVTEHKPPAIAYVDDLAVPFQGDWAAVIARIDEKGRTA